MSVAARARRAWWKRIRRYRYEICGRPDHPHAAIRRGCGRPVGIVWRAPTGLWNYVVAGQDHTAGEHSEGAGGVLCLGCFDRLAGEHGVALRWESRPLVGD